MTLTMHGFALDVIVALVVGDEELEIFAGMRQTGNAIILVDLVSTLLLVLCRDAETNFSQLPELFEVVWIDWIFW